MKQSDDSEAWETPEEKSAIDEYSKVNLYLGFITKSKTERKDWNNECQSAWREFQFQNDSNRYKKFLVWQANNFPRYWSDTMTMLPAIFSEIPELVANPEVEQDPIANSAALGLEKLAKFLVKRCDFRQKMTTACLEFLNCSRATARVYFEAEVVKRKQRIELYEESPEPQPDEEGQQEDQQEQQPEAPYFVDKDGNQYTDNIMYDQDGLPYVETEGEEEINNPCVYFEPLFFDQILISPGARTFSDIWFIAYQITQTRKDAYKKFGDIISKINDPATRKNAYLDDSYSGMDSADLFQYWEIWDKRDGSVYCVHENYNEAFLKPIDNEYSANFEPAFDLPGFYPCPKWMITNERFCDQYPVPDYTQTRDLYEQMHILFKSMSRVSASIKGVGLINGAFPDLVSLFNEMFNGQAVACSNFKDIATGEGGLDGQVWFPPYERLASTLQTQLQTFMQMKDLCDEIRGISDIIRGYSDPNTTLGAEKLKKAAASNRISLRQREVERFVRDLIEMMCDVALKTFDEDKLKEIMEFQFMSPEDQQNWDAMLSLLQDYQARKVRLDVETDSLIAVNEQEEKSNAMELLDSFGKYFQGLGQTIQQAPYIMPLAVKVSEIAMSKLRYGKNVQEELGEMFQGIQQQLQQPPQQPAPAPDPTMMKIQSDERMAQMENQLKFQLAQMDNQIKQMQLQLQAAEFQLKQQGQSFTENIETEQLNLQAQESQVALQEQVRQEQRLEMQNVEIPEEKMQQRSMMGQMPQMMPHPPINIINIPQPQQPQAPTQLIQPIVQPQPQVMQAPSMSPFMPQGII